MLGLTHEVFAAAGGAAADVDQEDSGGKRIKGPGMADLGFAGEQGLDAIKQTRATDFCGLINDQDAFGRNLHVGHVVSEGRFFAKVSRGNWITNGKEKIHDGNEKRPFCPLPELRELNYIRVVRNGLQQEWTWVDLVFSWWVQ